MTTKHLKVGNARTDSTNSSNYTRTYQTARKGLYPYNYSHN